MKNRKLSDVLSAPADENQLKGKLENVKFKIKEQDRSVKKYFPKSSKAILQILKRQNLDI